VTAGFRRTREVLLHEGHVISLGVVDVATPAGEVVQREVVHHPGAVSVVALTDADEVILVRQYRAALDTELWEIPAGKLDVVGEEPITTAARELEEEAGLRADALELLATFHNSPGFCDEHAWVYLATGLHDVPHDRQGVEEEHLVVERVPLTEALDRIARHEITDAKTIIGLLALDRRRRG
jgi:ADP-ribose pyrophosphatase